MANVLEAPIIRAVRYRCEVEARLDWEGEEHAATMLDVSRTGAFVQTELDLQVGDSLLMRVALPGGDPVGFQVTVMRLGKTLRDMKHPRVSNLTIRVRGVGLQFDELPEDEVSRLEGFLELLDER